MWQKREIKMVEFGRSSQWNIRFTRSSFSHRVHRSPEVYTKTSVCTRFFLFSPIRIFHLFSIWFLKRAKQKRSNRIYKSKTDKIAHWRTSASQIYNRTILTLKLQANGNRKKRRRKYETKPQLEKIKSDEEMFIEWGEAVACVEPMHVVVAFGCCHSARAAPKAMCPQHGTHNISYQSARNFSASLFSLFIFADFFSSSRSLAMSAPRVPRYVRRAIVWVVFGVRQRHNAHPYVQLNVSRCSTGTCVELYRLCCVDTLVPVSRWSCCWQHTIFPLRVAWAFLRFHFLRHCGLRLGKIHQIIWWPICQFIFAF